MRQDRRSSPVTEFFKRQYLVDRRFQLRYTIAMLGIWTVSAAVFGCSLAAALLKLTSGGVSSLGAAIIVTAPSLLVFSTLFVLSLLLTHRISGPIFVMSRLVDALGRGELPAPRPLRKNDEFQDFFRRLGGAIEYLRSKELSEAEIMERLAERLRARGGSPEDEALHQELLELALAKRMTSTNLKPLVETPHDAPRAAAK